MSALSHAAAERRLHQAMLGKANRNLVDYWLTQWRGDELPTWPLNTAPVGELLPGMVVFEFHPDDRLVCVQCGEHVRQSIGMNLVGQDWIAMALPEQRANRLQAYRTVASGFVGHSMRYAQHRSGEVHCIEEVMLPFAATADGVVSVLAHLSWRPTGADGSDTAAFRNSRSIPDETAMISLLA